MSVIQPVFNGSLNYDYSRLRYHEGKTPGLADSDMLTGGIALMMLVMAFFSDQAGGVYKAIQERQDVAREGQEITNLIEARIVKLDTEKVYDRETLRSIESVKNFFRKNNIQISAKDGYKNMNDFDVSIDGCYYQEQLRAMKSAAESFTSRASDFVSQNQLVIQKMMQAYNIAVQLVQSSQSMQAEQNKSIASAIR